MVLSMLPQTVVYNLASLRSGQYSHMAGPTIPAWLFDWRRLPMRRVQIHLRQRQVRLSRLQRRVSRRHLLLEDTVSA